MLAFDFGLKRTGVAVGDLEFGVAHPLTTIVTEENAKRFDAIGKLVEEWRPVLFVVGIPCHLDGTPHEMTARCTRFANQLEGRFGIPAERVDERLSSAEAGEALRDIGVAGRRQKPVLDQVAAQQILQTYFDRYPNAPT